VRAQASLERSVKPAPRRQKQHRRGEDCDRPEEPQRQEALPMALDESLRSRLATRLDLTGGGELMLAHHALMLLVDALDPVLQHPVDPARHQLDDLVDAAGAGHGVGLQANQLTDAELVAWHGRLLKA
jgi:hypothetical protein